jgi:hypothetical protein
MTLHPELQCPFDGNGGREAEYRRDIGMALGAIVNPLMEELAEQVEGGAVPPEEFVDLPVRLNTYDRVRRYGIEQQHPYFFIVEEDGAAVSGTDAVFTECAELTLALPVNIADTHPIRIPAGYDQQYTLRQALATAGVLKAMLRLRPRISAVASDERNAELLMRHTYQGVDRQDPEEALYALLCQGVVLSPEAEAVLTADEVEGYFSGMDLSRGVRDAGLVQEFTANAGSGMLWTSVRHGRRIKYPVGVDNEGSLQLSSKLRAYELSTKKQSAAEVAEARKKIAAVRAGTETATAEELRLLHLRSMYGGNCPAALSGVQQALRAIAHLANQIDYIPPINRR